jgi:hypothetical protein
MRWVAVWLFGVGALGVVSCKECDSVGCRNGPVLNFSRGLTEAGSYEIAGTLDDQSFSCQVTLDSAPSSKCDKPQIHVLFGGTTPASISGVSVDTNPGRVTVQIKREGQLLATGEANPSYQVSQPNGGGCEPICRYSEATLSLQ